MHGLCCINHNMAIGTGSPKQTMQVLQSTVSGKSYKQIQKKASHAIVLWLMSPKICFLCWSLQLTSPTIWTTNLPCNGKLTELFLVFACSFFQTLWTAILAWFASCIYLYGFWTLLATHTFYVCEWLAKARLYGGASFPELGGTIDDQNIFQQQKNCSHFDSTYILEPIFICVPTKSQKYQLAIHYWLYSAGLLFSTAS